MTVRTLLDRRLIAALVVLVALLSAVVATAINSAAASGAKPASHAGVGGTDAYAGGVNRYRRGPERYTIGFFGDMPYGALGRAQYPNLLASINQSDVAFSIFDGDLQAGGDGPCNDGLYTTSLANFNKLHRPLVWVRATTTGPTAGDGTARRRRPTTTRSSG